MKGKFTKKAIAMATALVVGAGVFSGASLNAKAASTSTNLTKSEFLSRVKSRVGESAYNFYSESGTRNLGNYYWCASFVSYCLNINVQGNYNSNRSTTQIADSYKSVGRFHDVNSGYLPQIGDIVIYEENELAYDGYDHCGVVVGVNPKNGGITTIEGCAFRWKAHKVGLGINDMMLFGGRDSYEAVYDLSYVDSITDRSNFLDFFHREGNVYKGWTSAEWDYYFESKKPGNSVGNRRVIQVDERDGKYCFIAGYCSPAFAKEVKVNLVRTREKNRYDISGDVNDDGSVSARDLVAVIQLLSEIRKDPATASSYASAYGNSLYDVNSDGRFDDRDYNKLIDIFLH